MATRYKVYTEKHMKYGNATLTSGNTYVDVAHGLGATPTSVVVTPTTNLGARSFWVSDKGSTTFRINIDSTDIIDHTFGWEVLL